MKYLLDTCTISHLLKDRGKVSHNFMRRHSKTLAISTLSIMELEYGFILKDNRYAKEHQDLKRLLAQITILSFSHETAKIAAATRANLKVRGVPIGEYDLLIAATALEHNLVCVTSNVKEFERVENLVIEDWY